MKLDLILKLLLLFCLGCRNDMRTISLFNMERRKTGVTASSRSQHGSV